MCEEVNRTGAHREGAGDEAWQADAEGADRDAGAEAGSGEADAMPAWKEALRRDFEVWLASVGEDFDSPEEDVVEGGTEEEPDLYSFFEQLAALNNEVRKANRRSAEAVSQWADTLGRFEQSLGPLRESVADLAAARPAEEGMPAERCLALVELLDRMRRLEAAASVETPRSSWWRSQDAAWRRLWEGQRDGLSIVVGHLETLLQRDGVVRFATVGEAFDPTTMVAVAVERTSGRPPRTVVAELASGYRRHGRLLRAAQVTVSGNE
ncbi:MAG: nucleotide exchange factor GrpE [Verrucomicrobiae bacterium]|nr:nucleotide exchange factor GrpE [Verrucomicrobiae bacterium]